MILADANVWMDHLRRPEPALDALLARREVLMHPFILGEIALGSLRSRGQLLAELGRLLEVTVAEHDEVLAMVEAERLFSRGIGYVDAHLVASLRLTPGTLLWTRDRNLGAVAKQFGLAAALA